MSVVAAALWWGEERKAAPADSAPQGPPSLDAQLLPQPLLAPEPPPASAVQDVAVAVAEDGGRPALCDGCLSERAVLDVVETYLRQLDPAYLHGEIWAHPLGNVAPEKPGLIHGQPKLPPGLLEAPEINPMGMIIDSRSYPVETTWIVWVQTGWVSRQGIEQLVGNGLPEVALSWPPIKEEAFVAVDSQTGKL